MSLTVKIGYQQWSHGREQQQDGGDVESLLRRDAFDAQDDADERQNLSTAAREEAEECVKILTGHQSSCLVEKTVP